MSSSSAQAEKPIEVAIVGGGCASIAAAFELTRPEHGGRYHVTIYQVGWRLGGKGASGRGRADRIEEHGLHVWMGFYENAFRLMRECYGELNRDPATCPIADWTDAFKPAPLIGVMDRSAAGQWSLWQGVLPPTEGLPGDPPKPGQRWTIADYMARSVALLRNLLQTMQSTAARQSESRAPAANDRADASAAPESVLDTMTRLLQYGELASLAGLIQAINVLEMISGSLSQYPDNMLLRFLDAVSSNARSVLESRFESDPSLQRVWQVIDLTLATLRGEVRFGIPTDPRGFDAIDDYDCREWLLLNGASESSVNCGFMRALYDLGFSYEDGDLARPRISAGQSLRGMVRAFFTYRTAFFWKMQAGMGDIVFAPLYEVLTRRGVRFEFFHRLENVKMAPPGRLAPGESPYIEALEFDVQADVIGGQPYAPLKNVGGLPCWPSAPDFAQLVDGERLRQEGRDFESHWDRRKARAKTLHVVDDFDFVVLGVGIGAIPYVCKELVARDPRWRSMVDHVKSVSTQAFQVWLSADMNEMGWAGQPITMSGFVEPFDTWADMRHLIAREQWPRTPRSLAYFCSVLPDGGDGAGADFVAAARERVRRNAITFLNRDVVHLWPRALARPGEFRWDLLVDPADADGTPSSATGEERFASQFWVANVNPSDRYVLSLPGSSVYRISPLDRTYDNLTIAGDWTDCGFNAGCVEAAVMSGRLAAHAISESPALTDIVGFDHP